MKMIIKENERGFVFRNGKFRRMIGAGKYHIASLLGETCIKTTIGHMVTLMDMDIQVLLRDRSFAASVVKAEVPDVHFALHYVDGQAVETLKAGIYYFWSIFHVHTFEMVDISRPETDWVKGKMALVPAGLYHKIEVPEGEAGLLYFDGRYQKRLECGSHYFWNGPVKVFCQIVDLRTQQLDISGQEILTADKVSLRLNFVCTYKIVDAESICHLLKDYKNQIYIMIQLAVREYVGRYRFDELLEQKDQIAGWVLEKLREKQGSFFIEFMDAGLKDIILPGEIRDIMNTVLIAEKNAQANVIARREEVASTRSLLNTAKLMDENITLYKLKELEYLERICDKVGTISVGNGNLLGQLGELLNSSNPK